MAQRSEDTSETLPRPGRRRCCPWAMARTRESWPSFYHYTSLNPTVRRTPSVAVCPEVRYTAMLTVLNDRRDMPKKPRRPLYRGCETAGRAMTPAAEFNLTVNLRPPRRSVATITARIAISHRGQIGKEGRKEALVTSAWCSSAGEGAHRGPFE